MVPSELAFFEVKKELIDANAAQFEHAELGVRPKAFDPIDVVFATSKLVLMMMDSMMVESIGHKAIIGLPAIGVNVARFQDVALENGHELSFGAVGDHAYENAFSTLVQPQDGRLSTGTSSSLATHPSRTKVAFIHLDLPDEWGQFHERKFHHPIS